MNDEFRASITINVLDRYLEACAFTEDRDGLGNDTVPHTSEVLRYRYDQNFGKALGGSFATTIGEFQYQPEGIVDGIMPYFSVPLTGVDIGTTGEEFQMLFIKHTGFQFDSTTALGASSSSRKVIVRKQYQAGGSPLYVDVCQLKPSQFMFIPLSGDLISGCNWNLYVEAGSAMNLAVQYAIMRDDLDP